MGEQSDIIVEQIKAEGRLNASTALEDLLEAARSRKPSGYNEHQAQRRRYFEGHQTEYLLRYLKKHYPKAWVEMDPLVVNQFRHRAEQLASAYKDGVDRMLVDEAGDPLPDENPQAVQFAELVRKAELHMVMPDADKKLAACKTAFLRVGVDMGLYKRTGQTHALACHYYPGDVEVIYDPDAPLDLQAGHALMARINSLDGEREWWEVWTRPEGGPWFVEHMSADGKMRRSAFGSDDAQYPLPHLPWMVVTDGIATGSPFLDVDRDAIGVQDGVNSAWTDAMFTRKMQAHGQLVIKSDTKADDDLTVGPGNKIGIGSDDDAFILNPTFSTEGIEAVERLMRQAAVLDRISPDAMTADGAPSVSSGIDRVIANIPQMEARRERVARWKKAEEGEAGLLALLIEVSDYWGGTNIGQVKTRAVFAEPKVYEDPEAKFRRTQEAYEAGLISKARFAVEVDLYDDLDAAVAAGLSDELERKGGGPSVDPTSLRERLRLASGRPDEPQEEGPEAEDEAA